jgi:hypothetical protein
MNKTIGIQLIAYGLLLGGLGYFAHYLTPSLARPAFVASVAGGVVCLFWGLRVLWGSHGKALPLLTLIPVTFVLLSQSVTVWSGTGEPVPGQRTAAAVITLLLLLSIAMLMRIAYAGVSFGGAPGAHKGQAT